LLVLKVCHSGNVNDDIAIVQSTGCAMINLWVFY